MRDDHAQSKILTFPEPSLGKDTCRQQERKWRGCVSEDEGNQEWGLSAENSKPPVAITTKIWAQFKSGSPSAGTVGNGEGGITVPWLGGRDNYPQN